MTDPIENDPWASDLLGYRELGVSFTNLIKSIEGSKVMSIEAGFGKGKTFFRRAWAEHLRDSGEVVIEIDAQKSDHSGDPVVTFIGALISSLPSEEKSKRNEAFDKGKKLVGLGARTVARAVLKSAADEMIESLAETASDRVAGIEVLENAVEDVGGNLSKLAGSLIATQLAAEQVRQKELPEQLSALRGLLTKDAPSDRIVILIDELDRCHPEYAIALLEAMKLLFNSPGFVFCLMVNAEYLEKVASKRFGEFEDGERYLDKFVDLRLLLPEVPEVKAAATRALAMEQLDVGTPFGESDAFTAEAAAEVAFAAAKSSTLSFRQIKRLLDRVEIALRCYSEKPLDRALLVFLAFKREEPSISEDILPRALLTPAKARELLDFDSFSGGDTARRRRHQLNQFVETECAALKDLDDDLYKLPTLAPGKRHKLEARVLEGLGAYYIPEHEKVLDGTFNLLV